MIMASQDGKTTEIGKRTLRVLDIPAATKESAAFSFINFLILLISVVLFWLFARLRKEFFFEE
jgi:hypothetical protein